MKKVVTDVDQLKPGMRVSLFFGENNVNNKTVHIRAIVDDEVFVICQWSSRKGCYQYSCEDRSFYAMCLKEPKFKFTITREGE